MAMGGCWWMAAMAAVGDQRIDGGMGPSRVHLGSWKECETLSCLRDHARSRTYSTRTAATPSVIDSTVAFLSEARLDWLRLPALTAPEFAGWVPWGEGRLARVLRTERVSGLPPAGPLLFYLSLNSRGALRPVLDFIFLPGHSFLQDTEDE